MEKISDVDFIKYDNSKRDEYIRLDTTIIGIDNLISKASTAEEANTLFKAKDVIYSQQRHFTLREPDNGWISVKDRLPDDKERYLICTEGGRIDIAYYQPIGDKFSDYEPFWQGSSCRFTTSVTHWQHLPEPPKGE